MKRVLLVEDNEDTAAAVAVFLKELGWAVDTVTTGADALALIEVGLFPDVVLADVNLPCFGGGGVGLLSVLKTMPGRNWRLVLMSGSPASHLVQVAEALGVPLLRKPFGRAELAEALGG